MLFTTIGMGIAVCVLSLCTSMWFFAALVVGVVVIITLTAKDQNEITTGSFKSFFSIILAVQIAWIICNSEQTAKASETFSLAVIEFIKTILKVH